ncbi:MAG: DNA alkylation repair protein [Bacteroidaceae bacterium]|nr:DNA alkylation repair protein [Bacteroidaceae bacterium]
MNGVASQYMRERGLGYHINFGVELPRLHAIAKEFEPNHEVAQRLWNENVRESKILACILMPSERFFPEVADIWVDEIPNAEIAQQAVLHLFRRLPYAPTLAFDWIASASDIRQLCGLLLVNHLMMEGAEFNENALAELTDQLTACQASADLSVRKAAQNAAIRLEEHQNLGSDKHS